ncbi:MAG: apolipoprotein N-acyltransferase [Candidatus Omnitrophota bacterium]
MLRKINNDLRPKNIDYRLTLLPILTAFLLVLAFPNFNLGFLAWIALIPLFFAIEGKGIRHRFISGYLFGISFFSGIFYWLLNVSVPATVLLILLSALYPAIFCSLASLRTVHIRWSIIFIPSLWVLTEFIRAHIFSGSPWALLAHSQSQNLPIIQIADITGAYGVSFLLVLVNFAIYLAFKKTPGRFYILLSVFLIVLLVSIYGERKMGIVYTGQTLKVAVIQGNIPQEQKWDPGHRSSILDKYAALTKEASKKAPHLIVWPESSVPGFLEDENDLRRRITGLAREGKAHILVGTLRGTESDVYNSATFVSDEGEILKSYDKIHLVPFGEFIPFESLFPWIRGSVDKPIGDYSCGKEHTVFNFTTEEAVTGSGAIHRTTVFHRFSVLICFEDIFPDLSREFVNKGARFLVNITNDAWFGKTSAPYQHMQGSVFRAIENRVPVIRSANTGFSCVINHNGEVITYVMADNDSIFVDGYLVDLITPVSVKTFYTKFGDLFSWACVLIVIFVGTVSIAKGARLKRTVSAGG